MTRRQRYEPFCVSTSRCPDFRRDVGDLLELVDVEAHLFDLVVPLVEELFLRALLEPEFALLGDALWLGEEHFALRHRVDRFGDVISLDRYG